MRVAIVNDEPVAIEVLRRALRTAPEHTIAWIARDGAEAVRRCASDPPDVVLMDLIMPVMDGVEATRQIMTNTPCAILVVTGDVTQTDLPPSMKSGLIDAVTRCRPIEGVAVVELTGADIVRHRLVREIVEAYDDNSSKSPRRKH